MKKLILHGWLSLFMWLVVATLLVAILLLVVFTARFIYKEVTTKRPMVEITSTSKLMNAFSNFRALGLDIESCSYTIETGQDGLFGTTLDGSDQWTVLLGSAVMSEAGAKALKSMSQFGWKPIKRDDIPAKLLAIVPPGDVLVSWKLNKSFEQKNTHSFQYGFVVTVKNDNWSRIYFFTADWAHPMKDAKGNVIDIIKVGDDWDKKASIPELDERKRQKNISEIRAGIRGRGIRGQQGIRGNH